MELVAHQIVIVRATKVAVKLAKIADIITANIDKFQNKNHSHRNDGNGKKLGDRTGKFNLHNSYST